MIEMEDGIMIEDNIIIEMKEGLMIMSKQSNKRQKIAQNRSESENGQGYQRIFPRSGIVRKRR